MVRGVIPLLYTHRRFSRSGRTGHDREIEKIFLTRENKQYERFFHRYGN